jgi:hypothetical protein
MLVDLGLERAGRKISIGSALIRLHVPLDRVELRQDICVPENGAK